MDQNFQIMKNQVFGNVMVIINVVSFGQKNVMDLFNEYENERWDMYYSGSCKLIRFLFLEGKVSRGYLFFVFIFVVWNKFESLRRFLLFQ